MPKCANGHDAGLGAKCQKCGAEVDFRGSLPELLTLPHFDAKFEEVAALFVGAPPFAAPGAYSAEAQIGKGGSTGRAFVAERVEGGTWLDYNAKYSERFRAWLRLVGFGKSRYRLLVVDTTNPLAVLAVNNVPLPDSTIMMATIPGKKATPVAQNSSYATLQLARRRGIHVLLALDSFVAGLAAFSEGKGLSTGEKAYEEVLSYIISFVSDLADATQKDARLGVGAHFFSVLLSGSDRVFRSVEGALEIQLTVTSLEGSQEKVITTHLFASAPSDRQREVEEAFGKIASREDRNLLNAESTVRERPSDHGLYDALLLFGVKEPTVLDELRAGYQTVASTAPELSLEGGLAAPQEAQAPEPEEGEPEEPEPPRPGPKNLALMEDFVMARAETVSLLLELRGDLRGGLLRYQAEVPAQKDPLEGLLGNYRDWLQGAFDEFAASISDEDVPPEEAERICAAAFGVAGIQDSTYSHDESQRGKADRLIHEIGATHPDLEGLSLVDASKALLKGIEASLAKPEPA